MTERIKIAVKDANILIDLDVAGLLDLWFQLGIETHTTIFVREEIDQEEHRELMSHFDSGNIIAHELNFSELVVIDDLMQEVNRAARFNDCTVLYLAEKLDTVLLTGDGALRKSANRRGVEVRGTLWIFDQLIEAGLLSKTTAAAKLVTLLEDGTYLPQRECDQRLDQWQR